jgi:hypothetical protein
MYQGVNSVSVADPTGRPVAIALDTVGVFLPYHTHVLTEFLERA